ncbi:MAG TPA: N-acetylmuramoyl-L-alanine amidase [Candidatus Kryptonia bacterium]
MTNLKLLLILSICAASSAFAQPKVMTLKADSNISYIGGFVDLNHAYVSVADLAKGLGLRTFGLQSTGKVSVYSDSGSVLLTPNNSFIVVSTGGESKTYQLPVPVLSANGKLYIAGKYASQYLSAILPGTLAFDESAAGFSYSSTVLAPPTILGIQSEEKANGAVIEIGMKELPKAYEAAIGQDNMLYVTLMPARVDTQKLSALPSTQVYSGVLAIQNPNSVQLSFKLTHNYSSHQIYIDSTTNSVSVALYMQADVEKIFSEELKHRLEEEKKNWKLDVIVIDPGHGGKDPGAIGISGVQEKDVTLAIAKALKKAINVRLPKVKVVMTRDDDEFVELDKRGEIANDSGGKLFVSIHCNSMPRKPSSPNGLETYFLRPGKTDEAIRIAAQENAAIKYENDYEKKYQTYDADNMILTTMAHSAYVKYSEQFAQLIEDNVSSVANVADDGVNQAGFIVLIGASMPAVLVESGYISNIREARYLKSKAGQQAIARGISNAIVQFKEEYEKNFTQN